MKLASILVAATATLAAPAAAQDKITFGTNWLAEAEHGGFYQAVVDGTYARYGLDVKILAGGPQANNRLLLATGRIDFYMGANMIQASFTGFCPAENILRKLGVGKAKDSCCS